MPSKKLHTLVIEKLIPGGLGLGRLPEGKVALVHHVLPGEKVTVREVNRKKDYISATLQEIATPSPDRTRPPCLLYGRCGGCNLQHVSYNTQLLLKKEIIAESLKRSGIDLVTGHETTLQPPVAAPEEFGYRQRIRLQINSKGGYGFFQTGSHKLVGVQECLLAGPALNTVLQQLHYHDSFTGLARHSTACELLFDPGSSSVFIYLHFKRKPRPGDSALASSLTSEISGLSTVLMQVEGYGLYDPVRQAPFSAAPYLSQTLATDSRKDDLLLTWEAGGFCQVNLSQNRNLINLVLDMIKAAPHGRVLDLYCGNGNFSLPVAQFAGEVVAIDNQNSAIRSGNRNISINKIHNCHFEKKQVGAGIHSLRNTGETFDAVLLDPPRQGSADIMAILPGLQAKQIIYVSCNPVTLARDLAILLPHGYCLAALVPVDMFPQTHHIECIALLKRSAG
ncbi:class I SAM-dependent RNA methyltransferase [Thermodesulfobacteriota bacterium]